MSQDIPKLEPPKTPNISKCKPKVRSRSRSLSEHSHQSPQKLQSRPSSRSKSRIKKQESFSSRSPSPIKESSEQNGLLPVSKNSLTEQMKSVLKTPRKVSKETDKNKKTRQVTEEEKPISVFTAVEDTMESIFQQVDKAMVDSAKKQGDNGIIEKADEELVEPPGSTIRVQSTRSSKLRKKSARSRLEMYKNLPPGRQEEYQACRTCFQGREEEERRVS